MGTGHETLRRASCEITVRMLERIWSLTSSGRDRHLVPTTPTQSRLFGLLDGPDPNFEVAP